MKSTRCLILSVFICVGLLSTGCEPGKTSSHSASQDPADSGVEDVHSLQDISDDTPDDSAHDAEQPEPDSKQNPDSNAKPEPDSAPDPDPNAPRVSILSPSDAETVDPEVEFSIAAANVSTVQIKVDDWPLSDPWDPASSSTLTYTLNYTGSPREAVLYGYDAGGAEIARDTISIHVTPSWNCAEIACSEVDVSTTLGKMRSIEGCAFEIAFEKPIDEGKALADRLLARLEAEGMGSRKSFHDVTQSLNRQGRKGLSQESKERMSGLNAKGFRWNQQDEDAPGWLPQGISGSSDAHESGLVGGKRYTMTAWYHKTDARPTKGARVTLADITNMNDINYRHLLLIDPYEDSNGDVNFTEAAYDGGNALHSGGIVWYGDYLFVADTSKGIRVYDLTRIFRPTTFDKNQVGISGGKASAHNYGFAIPRIARYRMTRDSCTTKFSFLGLDRTSEPHALINGGYDPDSYNKNLTVWPLDPATGLLEERGGSVRASQAAIFGQTRAQGVVRVNGTFHWSTSSQDGNKGRLYKGKPGQQNTSVNWLRGAEDVYYQRDTDRIWTNAEWPGYRDLVNIPLP